MSATCSSVKPISSNTDDNNENNKGNSKNDFFTKLAIEVLHFILNELDEKDQFNLALSCKWLYRVFRIYYFGIVTPKWEPFESTTADGKYYGPPAANYRDGVLLNGVLYIPILVAEAPICWLLDFKRLVIKWKKVEISMNLDNKNDYQPLRNTVSTVLRDLIYIFGGETLAGEPSNIFYELDTKNMILRTVCFNGDVLPSAKMWHSFDKIDDQHVALFGGRSSMTDDSTSKDGIKSCSSFYDTKDFYLYSDVEKSWLKYPDVNHGLPYARSAHSSLVVGYSLYIYGGQQISLNISSSQSDIHDNEDLWEFSFESNTRNIKNNFLQNKWKKLFSPRISTSSFFGPDNNGDWKETTGKITGKRRGAAMFTIGKKIAILGGYEKDNWMYEDNCNIVRPWEMCKLYSPEKRIWNHIRITGIPEMECIAIAKDQSGRPENVFVIGRTKGDNNDENDRDKGKLVMGWIRDNS
ncbi:4205_t:CDS:2 [Ambispora leptoticha]|uniref:4205_t:CDS:1 n=1 Tax=Ambispora leptoticha TaxID=144679 RepID=A0A9N8VML0_9GLOM|nr:4205_t:CDS:2 [Ambispora leptoticha]